MSKPALTAGRLRELLDYDPVTGIFRWRVAKARRIHVGDIAGSKRASGYRTIDIDGRKYLEHCLAWLHVHGEWPPCGLDHKDNVGDHNWIDNLRPATKSQNHANSRAHRNNKSGFKGVSYVARRRKWEAAIQKDGKDVWLGYFDSPEAAHAAYMTAAERLFAEFARAS